MLSALLGVSWEPELRGIVVVLVMVVVLIGGSYLIVGTNVGARLGLLIILGGFFGWMATMGAIWWVYGIGLKGPEPSWRPAEPITIVRDPAFLSDAGILSGTTQPASGDDVAATCAQAEEAVCAALVGDGWQVLERVGGRADAVRSGTGLPAVRRRCVVDGGRVGWPGPASRRALEVEELHRQGDARLPVRERVVELLDQCGAPVDESLDDGELPERTRAVERVGGDQRGEILELAHAAGRREGDVPDVPPYVELGVVHPGRRADASGSGLDALPEPRHHGGRAPHALTERGHVRRPVEDRQVREGRRQVPVLLEAPHQRLRVAHATVESGCIVRHGRPPRRLPVPHGAVRRGWTCA